MDKAFRPDRCFINPTTYQYNETFIYCLIGTAFYK